MKFQKKVCLVSGGSSGIGLDIVKSLASQGHQVVFYSRSKSSVNYALKETKQFGKNVIGYQADVTSDKDIKKVVDKTIKEFKKIDVLVNAAGVFLPFGKFEKVPFKDHLKPIEINLIGTMRACHFVIPYMKKIKFGRIINFSGGGVGGDVIPVHTSSYFTSKAANVVFTEVLARELEDSKITVNAILPGQILTKSTKHTLNLSKAKLGPILWEATQNLRKTGGGSVELVVNLINFLISDKASRITGKLLSAKWDSTEELGNYKDKETSYMFTLRRIEGKIYKKR